MKLIILESPYAGEVELNLAYARRALHHCLTLGEAPIASHLLYTQPGVLDDTDSTERAWGIQAGLEWLRVCDLQVFYTDLGWSSGMRHAWAIGAAMRIPYDIRGLDAAPYMALDLPSRP